ncbi:hypothetical protein ABZ770_33810 [Streptomyces sp. NPDC006654]|uniref:hypothetical protein n=1 Tax=Streptomyces sp. NPDC006654 TaxID=3156897 RepID=UPI0033FDA509
MRAAISFLLFLLAVLEMTAGVIAGSVALASLITEGIARALAAGNSRFARRYGASPVTARLREELAAVLSTTTGTGGAR